MSAEPSSASVKKRYLNIYKTVLRTEQIWNVWFFSQHCTRHSLLLLVMKLFSTKKKFFWLSHGIQWGFYFAFSAISIVLLFSLWKSACCISHYFSATHMKTFACIVLQYMRSVSVCVCRITHNTVFVRWLLDFRRMHIANTSRDISSVKRRNVWFRSMLNS